ncbi:NAD(P)H-dependent oxidoreductase [Acidaminobacter sp. JC074]|uniref:NAD(P)H-dependent oxidoreductase n=1 Tax=Acidaminobacter sp. JC074 TaxID=2530199 RepID=UPI001F0F4B3E|nr:NAD(P)H-dependent oxidoreductase [Acidaminobacter sp. JC074]MCH4890190.1 NAD(P)H-dependent oxidoreductase [Acidaminobacter sp. JC074]
MKVLVVQAHPTMEKSVVNKEMLSYLEGKDDVTVRRLYDLYPDWQIDKDQEQAACEAADRIVIQFPFYWYNMPALMKKWFDEVFEYNWAFGPEGDRLKNKEFLAAITIGGPDWSYQAGEYNTFAVSEFLKPIQQTAILSQMKYRKPFRVHDSVRVGLTNDSDELSSIAKAYYDHITDPLLDPEKKLEALNKEVADQGRE